MSDSNPLNTQIGKLVLAGTNSIHQENHHMTEEENIAYLEATQQQFPSIEKDIVLPTSTSPAVFSGESQEAQNQNQISNQFQEQENILKQKTSASKEQTNVLLEQVSSLHQQAIAEQEQVNALKQQKLLQIKEEMNSVLIEKVLKTQKNPTINHLFNAEEPSLNKKRGNQDNEDEEDGKKAEKHLKPN